MMFLCRWLTRACPQTFFDRAHLSAGTPWIDAGLSSLMPAVSHSDSPGIKKESANSLSYEDFTMRIISAERLRQAVEALILSVSRSLPSDVRAALQSALAEESSVQGREILRQLLANADYAEATGLPLCQDTGTAVFFVEMGEDARIDGAGLQATLETATRNAYASGYLRNSMCHPLTRANTGDNTPISLHLDLVAGDGLRIRFLPKGGGAENMSRCAMFAPSRGISGIRDFVLDTVRQAGPNPCPPIIVGMGVGGTFDLAPTIAKKALLMPLDMPNPDPDAAALEAELLDAINRMPIGPGGLGGTRTCLGVRLLLRPCHIASLPVAVNIQCNAARRGEICL